MSRKFRLESVKTLRVRQRDQAAGEVSEINRAIQIFQGQINEVELELKTLILERKGISTGELPVSELLDNQRYEIQLNIQLQNMAEKMLILENEKTKRDAKLLDCQKKLKAIEHLEEQHFEQLKIHDAKMFQSRLDEWANTNVIRDRTTF